MACNMSFPRFSGSRNSNLRKLTTVILKIQDGGKSKMAAKMAAKLYFSHLEAMFGQIHGL